ncbi:MAG: hypothetical protein HZA93_16365 [Verrucomicrobia bacterium]|nr:hypothetical protein [Verrucomicrobiota bacterium]
MSLVLAALGSLAPAQPSSTQPADPLRICLVSADAKAESFRAALATTFGPDATVTAAPKLPDGTLSLAALREAHAAVFHRGPGQLGPTDVATLREFLAARRGVLVLAAARDAWDAVPDFLADYLGAEPGGRFADGAPMSVINLFPHPIFAGVVRFETPQPMPAWQKLAADAQLIMEGTVGEDTTPLAWLRRRGASRIAHLVPASAALFADAAYLQIVANAVRWTARRPIPGAQPIVQRTFMPESHPGSFAITFPSGPGVCFDPVRGGVNFVWDGDFADLRPRWLTKQGEPARIFGPVFYREKNWQPLRAGAPGREPAFQFRGYRLTAAGPEFHYQIEGRDVFETLAATAGGAGLVRRFRVGAGRGPLWIDFEPQTGADIALTGLVRDGDRATFASSAAGEFTIEIRRKSGAAQP